MSNDILKARAAVGVAARRGHNQEPARRDLAAAKIEQFVQQTVASAPPLTTEQRDRIAALLHPAVTHG